MYSLWQGISFRTKGFDPVTLTLTFDLFLKKNLTLVILVFIETKPFVWPNNSDPLIMTSIFDLILKIWKCFMITIISSLVYTSLCGGGGGIKVPLRQTRLVYKFYLSYTSSKYEKRLSPATVNITEGPLLPTVGPTWAT